MSLNQDVSTHYTFTIEEFCRLFKISRATLYNLWHDEKREGPDSYVVGRRRFISNDAALRWQKAREA